MPGGNSITGGKVGVRVVVAGDRFTGKSSLIAAAATETYPENVPRVLPPTRLPADFFPDRIPITIIDTSAALESRGKLIEELKRADVVVLTYSCDQPLTLSRLSSFWLEELRRLEVKVPVIVVGCKLDLRDEAYPVSLEQVMGPIMQQHREIETCIECSAVTLMQVPDVFFYAQKAVLHPTAPLFDQEHHTLKPRCERALRRIFLLCDHDMDGALNDLELNNFQVKCFNAPLQPAEIVGVRRVVQEKKRDGVNDIGLTLEGFLFLHSLFIDRGRIETTWTVLRKFGYDDELKLRDDLLPVPYKHAPDQSIELTIEVVEFLRGIFRLFDIDNHGALRPSELDELFSTAPENPWCEAPYKDAAERTMQRSLTFKGFLSGWDLMTLLNPKSSLANLIYVGYSGNPASALHVTRRRTVDRKKQQTERNVFHCLVFGPKNAGKSALLNSFLGRPFSESFHLPIGEHFAANVVDQLGGIKKTLILREVPEDGVKKYLSNKESLAACDVAVFVYDCSDEYSWKRSCELLVEIVRQGEESGYGMPCLLIAAKDDLDPYPMAVQDSVAVCQELGIEAPIPVSTKLGEMNNVFCRILSAAVRPHLNIPETESGRRRKVFRQLVNHSLIFMSVGAGLAVVGLAAFRAYSARKNSSN
ncbi:rac-GTP binding protein, putative [Ricinus communis]|uniref:Mitochondrial Rho GTPase n=1 Tax=Ricinus communis TaxID=3988 RepID=B9S433_RICCO|nr:rac-GTP binding protein, putative [Ricinus communis]|eukprot:XP_002520752.1 mitochondrial Rho GTPase 2 isoform X1 [Ricinus communis]